MWLCKNFKADIISDCELWLKPLCQTLESNKSHDNVKKNQVRKQNSGGRIKKIEKTKSVIKQSHEIIILSLQGRNFNSSDDLRKSGHLSNQKREICQN